MRKRNASRNNNTVPGFLSKTYKILENAEYTDIISWNEDGKAFKVKKPNEFAEKVLPKYFKTNNFASFVRQLNMYDFHKLRHDSEENEWRHRLFRRGYPQYFTIKEIEQIFGLIRNLLCEIKRKINETQMQEAVVSQKEQKKITNDTQYLLKEMSGLKQKQESLEKACGLLIAQNTQILGENKVLWSELNKKKDKAQKKIEKLFGLFLSCIGGPKQISELAFMNGKKPNEILHHQDYLKQEDMSDNDNEDDHRGGNRNLTELGTKRWDPSDIAYSLNGFPFNTNNQNNNISSSFNGGLNCSNMLSSQNGGNGGQQLLPMEIPQDQNVAQKFLEGLMKNLKNKQENKGAAKGMGEGGGMVNHGSQINNFVENYHKSNQDMLQNLQNFMNSQGGTSDLSSVELNNQINQATMNPTSSTDLLQKRPIKKMIGNNNNNSLNQHLLIQEQDDMDNQQEALSVNKKVKKNEDGYSQFNGNNQNPFGNGSTISNNNAASRFNLEDYINQQQQQQLASSNIFNCFDMSNGNNKPSLDFSKLNNHDYASLALPQSTTVQPRSPIIKKPRNNNNNSIAPLSSVNQGGEAVQVNKSLSNLGMNDSVQGYNNGVNNAETSNLYNIQSLIINNSQNNMQWEDFNKFIQEQKIEEPPQENSSGQKNNNGAAQINRNQGNSHNIINEEFLGKESIQKLNESII